MLTQRLADHRQAGEAHVEHQRLAVADQLGPVQIDAAILELAGDELHALRVIAVRERDAGISGAAVRSGDAGHDLERYLRVGELFDLLAAATEDERITALEPRDALAAKRMVHQ